MLGLWPRQRTTPYHGRMISMVEIDIQDSLGRDMPPSGVVRSHGLLASAAREPTASRWLPEGITFTPILCTTLHEQVVADVCLDFDPPGDLGGPTYQTCPGVVSFPPHVIELAIEVQVPATLNRQTWLTGRIMLGLSESLESLIWPDSDPSRPWLGGGAALTANSNPLVLLGSVEDAILDAKAGGGVLHMAPSMAARVADVLVEDPLSGALRTKTIGSKVVVGNYPAGRIAGHIGEIDVHIGPSVYQTETHDRATNTTYQHVWIEAAAAWHTCGTFVGSLA